MEERETKRKTKKWLKLFLGSNLGIDERNYAPRRLYHTYFYTEYFNNNKDTTRKNGLRKPVARRAQIFPIFPVDRLERGHAGDFYIRIDQLG